MIELWASCGYDETNEVFMHSVCRYIYNVYALEQQQLQGTLEEWRIAWTYSEKSINSPLQGSSNHCGIFTLVSLALLRSGARLRRDSYSQDIV